MSFFTRLGALCSNVEQELAVLEKEYEIPPGSFPARYDTGMNCFKEHLNDLKAGFGKLDEGVKELDKFSDFCDSLDEMIEEYREDIISWETELKRFGYVPQIKDSNAEEEVKIQPDMEEDSVEMVPEKLNENMAMTAAPEVKEFLSPVNNQAHAYDKLDQSSARLLFSVQRTPASMARKMNVDKFLFPVATSQIEEDDCVTPFVLSRKSKSRGPETVQKSVRFAEPNQSWRKESLEVESFDEMMNKLPKSPSRVPDEITLENPVEDMALSGENRKHTPEEPAMSASTKRILKATRKPLVNPKSLDTVLCNRKDSEESSVGGFTPGTPKSPGMSEATTQTLKEIKLLQSNQSFPLKFKMSPISSQEKENFPSIHQ